MHAAPSTAVGSRSEELTASGSPNSSEKVCSAYCVLMLRKREPIPSKVTSDRAVTTSCWPRRPHLAIATTPRREKVPTPSRVLAPISAAPAAPVNAPWGMACAAKLDPRSTTKKPTAPATTAMTLASSQVPTMNPKRGRTALAPPNPAGPGDPVNCASK